MTVKNILEKIPDIILAQLAAFSLVYGLTSSLVLTYPALKIFLWTMLAVLVLFALFYNRRTSIAGYSLIGVTVFVMLCYLLFGVGIRKAFVFVDDYFYWLGDFIQYPDIPDPLFQNITVAVLCILISVFAYIFILRKFLFLVITIAGMGLFTIQWSFQITSSLVPFYLYLLVVLVSYLKHIYLQKSAKAAEEFAKPSAIAVWSLPVCIIIIALASSIYASSKPIEWKWLDKKIFSIYNYFSRNLDYEAFDYFSLTASSGFGDRNNILGGRVRLDRTNVLQVKSGGHVYLRGAIQDTYTGSQWTGSVGKKTPLGKKYDPLYEDTSEMLEGMKILTGDNDFLDKYFTESELSVTYLNLKTKSLFLPEKANSFSPKTINLGVYSDNLGSISVGQRISKGFNYKVKSYTADLGADEFAAALRQSKRGLYSDYLLKKDFQAYYQAVGIEGLDGNTTDQAVNQAGAVGIIGSGTGPAISIKIAQVTDGAIIVSSAPVTGSAIDMDLIAAAASSSSLSEVQLASGIETPKPVEYNTVKALKQKSEKIYNEYLQVPNNLPQRVKDLAVSLVSRADTDYDKAKAIEQYLSKNYPYNLDVRSTPRNRDFVDYFLFDLKQGYCSYYASAMAVLARCVGLPARYVEGYMLPPEPTKNDSTTYIVTNMQAHAWVEIYFEGYGWLPFEPTSPFSASFYSSSKSDAVYAGSDNYAYYDYMEMIKRYSRDRDPGNLPGVDITEEKAPVGLIILITFGSILLIFLLLLLFNGTRNRFRLYKMMNLPSKDCVVRFYGYFEGVLSLLGLGLVPAETPLQYSERIDSTLFFSPVRFKVITDIFIKARYSLKETNEKEKQLYCDFHRGFLDEVKISMGKSKYFLFKYILGRF